ncbi:MAG: exonuclease domain-containing protein [Rudaea sp.]
MPSFVAIDVETANADLASICQIGIARFVDGELIDTWSTLVDPEDDFDGFNISIHGIRPEMIKGKPNFASLIAQVQTWLGGTTSVCHTHFDRVAITCATDRYELKPIDTRWIDSACVARRTWKECAGKGYGLSDLCKRLGYKFNHHDALEDAKAAGFVMLAAMKESGMGIDEWFARVLQPIEPSTEYREGNPDGLLFGETLVFTGALMIPRREAADMAAHLGCMVGSSVTKKTTILVVGDQDMSKLAGHEKSAKHRKAEELISAGVKIRILRESDFKKLCDSARSAILAN